MAIKVGDKFPEGKLSTMKNGAPADVNTNEYFAGRKVALFALPGAFTPTCSKQHLPGFVQKAAEFKTKGIDEIACLSVNDAFVMDAWGKDQGADGKVTMLADGGADVTKALGLVLETGPFGGIRSKRYAMLVVDGVVRELDIDESGFDVSSAESLLCKLK